MSGVGELSLRQAIWAALNADSTLTSTYGAGVYQRVEDDTRLPYVVIGPVVENALNTFGRFGRELVVQVDIWHDDIESKEVYQIADRVDELLDFTTSLSPTGYNLIALHLDSKETIHEEKFIHVASRYRAFMEES